MLNLKLVTFTSPPGVMLASTDIISSVTDTRTVHHLLLPYSLRMVPPLETLSKPYINVSNSYLAKKIKNKKMLKIQREIISLGEALRNQGT